MLRFHVAVLLAFFFYLLTYVSGCPEHAIATQTPRMELREDKLPLLEKTPDPAPAALETIWGAGLLERTILQRKALSVFRDPLLESDSRPDKLLRGMERSLTADIVLLFLCLAWSALLLATLGALRRKHWFYRPMLLMVLGPLVVALLLVLMNVRRPEVIEAARSGVLYQAWLLLGRIYVELTLLLGGSALFLARLLPERTQDQMTELSFMGHLMAPAAPGRRVRRALSTVAQISAIMAAALATANLILFPLYILQISFPRFFAGLLAALLLALSFFYVRAYVRVSQSQSAVGGTLSGSAFLGFRLLRNTLFVSATVLLVVVTVSIIIVITMLNIDFLQSVDMLQRPQSI